MHLTGREFWTLVHGMGLGSLFLLAFAGGLAGFYSLRPEWLTAEGITERVRRLQIGTTVMAVVSWLVVITGTYIVYPWYRAGATDACSGVKNLPASCGPKWKLLANANTADWHNFAMEWKEHVAWLAPMLATVVAVGVLYYGADLVRNRWLRSVLMWTFTAAFIIAGIAGLLGALITKSAPVA
jgi:hypothetical protein